MPGYADGKRLGEFRAVFCRVGHAIRGSNENETAYLVLFDLQYIF